MVLLLFFNKDGFGIKQPMKGDMPLKQNDKPSYDFLSSILDCAVSHSAPSSSFILYLSPGCISVTAFILSSLVTISLIILCCPAGETNNNEATFLCVYI